MPLGQLPPQDEDPSEQEDDRGAPTPESGECFLLPVRGWPATARRAASTAVCQALSPWPAPPFTADGTTMSEDDDGSAEDDGSGGDDTLLPL